MALGHEFFEKHEHHAFKLLRSAFLEDEQSRRFPCLEMVGKDEIPRGLVFRPRDLEIYGRAEDPQVSKLPT